MKHEIFSGASNTLKTVAVPKEVEPAVVGGDLLIGSGTRMQEVTQLVAGVAEPASRSCALEPAHQAVAAFDAAMILLQQFVEVLAVAVPHTNA